MSAREYCQVCHTYHEHPEKCGVVITGVIPVGTELVSSREVARLRWVEQAVREFIKKHPSLDEWTKPLKDALAGRKKPR